MPFARHHARRVAVLAACLLAAACATAHETAPAQSATEQLLLTHSAERAAIRLKLALPPGSKVALDASSVSGAAGGYLIAAVRAALLRGGMRLVDRPAADVIVELRCGALSIDQLDRVWGLPAMTIPTSTSLRETVTTPELSLFSSHSREGVAEIAAVALDAHTGALIAQGGPVLATTRLVHHQVLTAFSWGAQEIRAAAQPVVGHARTTPGR